MVSLVTWQTLDNHDIADTIVKETKQYLKDWNKAFYATFPSNGHQYEHWKGVNDEFIFTLRGVLCRSIN